MSDEEPVPFTETHERRESRECATCKGSFEADAKHPWQRYCGVACRIKAARWRKAHPMVEGMWRDTTYPPRPEGRQLKLKGTMVPRRATTKADPAATEGYKCPMHRVRNKDCDFCKLAE